jgi:hypothetical protein
VSWHERVYGLLVALYPPGFRREYGPALRQVFREMARDRAVPAWRLWATVFGDVPGSMLREHIDNLRGGDVSALTRIVGSPATRQGTLVGLAMGLLWTVANMVNQGVTLDARASAVFWAGCLAALVLLYALAGFAGARRTGSISEGVTTALVTWIVGSAIGVATMWLATGIFYQGQLADPGMVADFQRSGLASMDAFIVDDNLRASVTGPAMSLVVGVAAGTVGAALGSRTGARPEPGHRVQT